MAKKLYDIRNYPRNAGTSQPGRYNASLMGDNVAIIEQNIADYIVFAHKLSHYLKYYNDRNEEAGNWQNFLTNDVSYHLAIIAAEKPKLWNETWSELMENVEATDSTRKNENKKYYTWRFDFLYTLIGRLADAFIHSKQLPQWENDLKALYTTANLNIIFDLLEKYNKSSKGLLVDDAGNFFYKDLTLNKRTAVVNNIEINNDSLSEILVTDDPLIPNGDLIFGNIDAADVVDRINAASEYLDDLAQQLLRLYARVHDLSETHLRFSLTNFDAHQPHIGLFYAFLQLLQENKTDINSLILKHLDFYYKEVLSVKLKPYQPSKAYVTFELAKNVNDFLVKTGSSLSAGKDAKEKDIFYKTQQDIVVNKAVTGDIKSFTIIKNKDGKVNERKKDGEPLGIFACAKADSSDGKEKPLQPGESWNAFRASSPANDLDTQIGISFYSSLVLQAPPIENIFQLVIVFKSSAGLNNLKSFVESYGTIKIFTEKEPLISSFIKVEFSNSQLTIEFKIPEKTKIKKTAPNLSLVFGRKASTIITDDFFAILKALQTVEVASFSLTLLNQTIPVSKVETVLGMTDLSASFPAFGGVPKNGSWFKVIEPALKGKTISSLTARIEWASRTERPFDGTITYNTAPNNSAVAVSYNVANDADVSSINIISPGNTSPVFSQDYFKVSLISSNDLGHRSFAEEMANAVSDDYKTVIPYLQVMPYKSYMADVSSIQQEAGVQKKVKGDFDFADRFKKYEDYFGPKRAFPKPPYTPVIKSISLVCTLKETISFNQVYYQYPFGYKNADEKNLWIVPSTPCEGELYIGFKELKKAQSLNVLIQVEEGSSDPTLKKPEVTWMFLHNNNWQNFDSAQFKDGTNGLIQSGIVSFVSPDYDCLSNTLLPAGQFWIRADVKFNETKATCKIFSVNTQAVLAQFIDSGNDAASLGSNLPANSITQLFPKQSSVKKVTQPYASFGGRLEEENKKLYVRTSERLRHKGRAANAWDYEHIIAEAFPEIYKAKVLNHAHLKIVNDEKTIVSKAGEMIILVIGKTAAQSSIYKPLVSKAKLTEITELITQLNSPFAKVDVMNPLFEEITVDTIVTFRPHIKDETYYEKQLQTDIKRFLSPWAFENGAEPDFGGVIYRAALLDFIEELSYIDFVEKLEIRHQNTVTGDVAIASSPASILISAPMHIVDGNLATSEINSSINDLIIANQ